MRQLSTIFKEVKIKEKSIIRTINNVNFKCIPVQFAARVVEDIFNLSRVIDDNGSHLSERRLKLILANDLTGAIINLQWQCAEQIFQNAVSNSLKAALCRKIAASKKKRTGLLARRDSLFKKEADKKIVNVFNQVFQDHPSGEDISKDGDDNLSVLRALARPSTCNPLDEAGLTRHEELAPPLMSTSLIPAPREYVDISNNFSAGLTQISAVNITMGEACAILGIQPPDELPSYAEEYVPNLPTEQGAPTQAPVERPSDELHLVETVRVGMETTAAILDIRNAAGEISVPKNVTDISHLERFENGTTYKENGIAPMQNITGFIDITLDEIRMPHVHKSGKRELLADVEEIKPAINNSIRGVIPETPDSDIHQLLEPVIPTEVLQKKTKLIIDKQTKIQDYSARAVRLANQPHSNRNIYEKTNFNLKRIKITMSSDRLFKTPACSSMFNPIRGLALTKIYERNLLTDEKTCNEIPKVTRGDHITRNTIAYDDFVLNVPQRQNIDGISMIRDGDNTNLSLPGRVSMDHRNTVGIGLDMGPALALNIPQEIAIESLNIADNSKQTVPQGEILDDTLVAQPAVNGSHVNNVAQEGNIPQNSSILRALINNAAAAADKNNLIDNIHHKPGQPESSIEKAQQHTTIIDHALHLAGVNLTNVEPELVIPPVENVSLIDVEKNNLTENGAVTMPHNPLTKEQPEQIFSGKDANKVAPVQVEGCPFPAEFEVMLQPPISDGQLPDHVPQENPKMERDLIRVIPIARLQDDNLNTNVIRESANELIANNEPAALESGGETTARPVFQPRGDPPRNKYRSSEIVMKILRQNWELVNIISITDILGSEYTINNEVILIKTLIRLNKQWDVQLNKIYDTLAISPFPDSVREVCKSF